MQKLLQQMLSAHPLKPSYLTLTPKLKKSHSLPALSDSCRSASFAMATPLPTYYPGLAPKCFPTIVSLATLPSVHPS